LVEFGDPDVEIGNLVSAEVVDDVLDAFEFLGEDLAVHGAGV